MDDLQAYQRRFEDETEILDFSGIISSSAVQ